MENEQFYDDEIAPLLAKAAALCKEREMPMLAAVYYEGIGEDASGLTQSHPHEKPNPCWYLMRKAWAAQGNIDQLCINIAREVGPDNSSVVLRMMKGNL